MFGPIAKFEKPLTNDELPNNPEPGGGFEVAGGVSWGPVLGVMVAGTVRDPVGCGSIVPEELFVNLKVGIVKTGNVVFDRSEPALPLALFSAEFETAVLEADTALSLRG